MLTLLCGGPVERPFCNSLLVTVNGDLRAALGVLGDTGMAEVYLRNSRQDFILSGYSFWSCETHDQPTYKWTGAARIRGFLWIDDNGEKYSIFLEDLICSPSIDGL
jgi:hypothetical protein